MVNKGSVLQQERNLSAWFARFLDAGLIFAAHYVATFSRDWRSLLEPELALGTLLAAATFIIIGDANGLYRPTLRSAPPKVELGKVWLSWGFTPPVLLTAAFITKTGDTYSRVVALIWF